jgi:hypothetical protein
MGIMPGNGNDIKAENLGTYNGWVAVTTRYEASSTTLSRTVTTFNTYYPRSDNGSSTVYDVQNTMTHEFGHWLRLKDISTSGCSEATMWYALAKGETKKRTLASYDVNGISWQYP